MIEENAPPQIHGEPHLTRPEDAEAYLKGIARQAFAADLSVTCHVHVAPTSDVARGILAHQGELAPDLIVMCSHGRGDLRDLLFGRIAQQVVESGHTPVFLLRPGMTEGRKAFACRLLLAPTDAEPKHARGPDVASELAKALHARLHLLSVVPTMSTLAGRDATTSRFMPGTSQMALEMAEKEFQTYLEGLRARYEKSGLSVSSTVLRGDPAGMIAEYAEAAGANVIVLGTHGKAGAKAFWAGSVTAKVLARTRVPALLVPVS